jgi:hypothetical protein
MRAAAMAASHPACPAPTTATSYCSVNCISWQYRLIGRLAADQFPTLHKILTVRPPADLKVFTGIDY